MYGQGLSGQQFSIMLCSIFNLWSILIKNNLSKQTLYASTYTIVPILNIVYRCWSGSVVDGGLFWYPAGLKALVSVGLGLGTPPSWS